MASMKEKLDQYWALRRDGVPAPEAAKQVWPEGMPSAQQYQEQQQREKEKSGRLGQIGVQAGATAGSLGGMYLASKLAAGGAAAGAGAAGAAGATAAGTGAIATPTLLSVGAPTGAAAGSGAAAGGAGAAGTAAGGIGLGTAGALAAAAGLGLNQIWEGGAKDILRGRGDRSDWINTGLVFGTGGIGGIPNLALRLMGKRSIGQMMTTGKSGAQRLRDDFRGDLRSEGIADQDYNVTLADGSKFNIGLDGKTKYQNVGTNIDGKTERNAWDVDFSNPLAQAAIAEIDPHVRSIYKEENGVKPEQYTGMLVNAALSNAKTPEDVKRNVAAIMGRSQAAQMQNKQPAPVNDLDETARRLQTSFRR